MLLVSNACHSLIAIIQQATVLPSYFGTDGVAHSWLRKNYALYCCNIINYRAWSATNCMHGLFPFSSRPLRCRLHGTRKNVSAECGTDKLKKMSHHTIIVITVRFSLCNSNKLKWNMKLQTARLPPTLGHEPQKTKNSLHRWSTCGDTTMKTPVFKYFHSFHLQLMVTWNSKNDYCFLFWEDYANNDVIICYFGGGDFFNVSFLIIHVIVKNVTKQLKKLYFLFDRRSSDYATLTDAQPAWIWTPDLVFVFAK